MSSRHALATIDFHQTAMSVLTNDQGDWVFPGQLCRNMGLDGVAQRKAIERSRWSAGMTCVTHVMLPGETLRQTKMDLDLNQVVGI